MLGYLRHRPSFLSSYLPRVAQSIGALFFLVPVLLHLLAHPLDLGAPVWTDLLGHLVVAGPFAAALIYGGDWLRRSDLPARRFLRIEGWLLGGLLIFLVLNLFMIALWPAATLYANVLWGLWAAHVGAACGLVIGLFEARAITHALSAERSRVQQREAERRSEQFRDFAQIVSHDLRNPLNVARGRLELAREAHDSDHLAAVERALSRMDEIIEDVLALTWSQQQLEPKDLDGHMLGEVASTCWEHVDTEDAALRIEDNPRVRANERRLRRLLENLFRNAIEHGEGEVVVRVGALSDGFFVEDTGPGIPEEKQEHVFEAGYTSSENGTGLGLNIVRTIAEGHGWDVSATTGRAGGARFEFVGHPGDLR